ncbi:MAG: NUDIX domain-containing protein [Candidatus Pacebacteria bacterium]|nr:NUDIX domain-containing protein [Candidatus Paceibacterota bacterium]
MENKELKPMVGVGVMVFKDGKILLGKRLGKHGSGEYAVPGGHLDYMESFEECAKRETKEESGIEIKNIRFLNLFNLKDYAPKHYVSIGLIADWESGEPQVLEKDKIGDWAWYDIDDLPKPLFGSVSQYRESYKTGKNYFDF